MYAQDRAGRGPRALEQAVVGLIGPANQTPGLTQVFTLFNTSTPQVYADIDRTKAEMLGVPITRFFDTLSTYMGSVFVNDFNILGRTYRVNPQPANPCRPSPWCWSSRCPCPPPSAACWRGAWTTTSSPRSASWC